MLEKILPIPSHLSAEHKRILRRNIRLHIGDGAIYVFGISFVAIQTIYPVFLKELGANAVAIGAVPVLWTIGVNIPMAFMLHFFKPQAAFKPAMALYGFLHRFFFLVSGIAALLLIGNISTRLAVPIFLFLLSLTAVFGSFGGLPWFQVFTKTVPVKLRGRLMGVRQLIGALLGIASGYCVSVIIKSFYFPFNFALLFFAACLFTMVSFWSLARIEEISVNEIASEPPKSFNVIEEAKKLLRQNKNYRNYVVTDALLLMSTSGVAFFSVHAIEKFHLSASYAGTFTVFVMIGNIIGNVVFGYLADTFGHKVNLLFFAISSALSSLLALIVPDVSLYSLVFVLMAFHLQILGISRLPFVAEMCSESERPLYVGILNTLTAPSVFVGVLFGLLVPSYGYSIIFLITTLLAISGFFVLYTFVDEPRKRYN